MARKIYQLSTLTSHDEVVTKEENEEKVVGKEIGTLVYNRINKSGSTSLLSWWHQKIKSTQQKYITCIWQMFFLTSSPYQVIENLDLQPCWVIWDTKTDIWWSARGSRSWGEVTHSTFITHFFKISLLRIFNCPIPPSHLQYPKERYLDVKPTNVLVFLG